MSKIKNELNSLIMQAMKEHKKMRLEALRAIKTAFMNWETSKEHTGKELTDADEIQIIKKLVKQREESIEQFMAAGRDELANEEHMQMIVLKEFLPAEATEEQVIAALIHICNTEHIACDKRNMGVLIKKIKEALPTSDGKMVATVVQKNLS